MAELHVRLVLNYFQAKHPHERTEATLLEIVQYLADTYVLPLEDRPRVYAAALACAQQRGWLPEE